MPRAMRVREAVEKDLASQDVLTISAIIRAVAGAFLEGPMTDEERLAFFQEIIPLVRPENMRWKATDWANPTEWLPRCRGVVE